MQKHPQPASPSCITEQDSRASSTSCAMHDITAMNTPTGKCLHLVHLKDTTALISRPSSGSTRMRSFAYSTPTMFWRLSSYTGILVKPAQRQAGQHILTNRTDAHEHHQALTIRDHNSMVSLLHRGNKQLQSYTKLSPSKTMTVFVPVLCQLLSLQQCRHLVSLPDLYMASIVWKVRRSERSSMKTCSKDVITSRTLHRSVT